MPTELNHTEIEQRIESVLEANAALYNDTSIDGSKLVVIDIGFPFTNNSIPEILPGAFIYKFSETNTKKGTDVSNSTTRLSHDIKYNIVVVVSETTSKETEQTLNTFEKLVKESLEANTSLTSAGIDPKVDDSYPESDKWLRNDLQGQCIQGRTITLRCIAST